MKTPATAYPWMRWRAGRLVKTSCSPGFGRRRTLEHTCGFPEYGAMELATLAGLDVAGDLEASLHAVAQRLKQADAIHAVLARDHGVHFLAASGPAYGKTRPVNRACLITPTGLSVFRTNIF